jgi:hypothetical protein
LFFFESLYLDKVAEELSALDEAHDKVDAQFVLENELHVHYKGMVHLEEDVLLKLNVLILLIVNHDVLADALHRIEQLGALVLHEIDLPKCALSNHFHDNEILKSRNNLGWGLNDDLGGGSGGKLLFPRKDQVTSLLNTRSSGRLASRVGHCIFVVLFLIFIGGLLL